MSDNGITENSTVSELAVIISKHLEAHGLISVLTGGSLVTIYTDINVYESKDLDFISPNEHKKILSVMEKIEFIQAKPTHKHLSHPRTKILVEFPTGPVNLGGAPIRYEHIELQEIQGEKIRMLSPTQSVMDRLLHYIATKDPQGLDQAQWICERQPVNYSKIQEWAKKDGQASESQYTRICERCEKGIAIFNKSISKA